ncbi:MAG TPA: class I SAM-dependent DNA methyltransferase, partial [Candidatus Hydrogenedentes bacterium]|nr:class I SAM-dependent DNA methyltransferase [Candidatus Hydrogenedentota bacterium]
MPDVFRDIDKLEADLWEAADNLRANSKLTSSDYFMPVLGVIFLRHAANRFDAATRQIQADQASGKMPKRKVQPADYISRRALWLPEAAHYDTIMKKATSDQSGLPKLVTGAMEAIEAAFDPLKNVLPKDYGIFEPAVLENLMRTFNTERIKNATGDVFGRIYEYFLAKFSIQKAHDNGEFFTPASIVQTIVNVIEPDHGTVFDPACGSGGMFVQSSHFIEQAGGDTAKKVVFYGQEKNRDTIRIAKMNLAVHGLEGQIAEAITYYQDEHSLYGKCDFVMANPPFNVDLVDAERIQGDPRLPFGLPGVNKAKKVSNGNYLWLSYFWSYLNEKGRAGCVMSSQASSAGHGEKEVRRKMVETGDVDVMVSIRSNFFYTRTVPCELWFFDRGKPAERRDTVLMIDARNVFRKVNRKINDFSPEQLHNLAAIVWLYRGQRDRFLALVTDYFRRVCEECAAVPGAIDTFEKALGELRMRLAALAISVNNVWDVPAETKQPFLDALLESSDAVTAYIADRKRAIKDCAAFVKKYGKKPPKSNAAQHAARHAFEPVAERLRGLVKQVDLVFKLTARVADHAANLVVETGLESSYDRRAANRLVKQLDDTRKDAVEQLKRTVYFHRQVAWLEDRFPKADLEAVPG